MTNVTGSTLSREADYTLLLHAGPEIAVASTKAYVAQVAVLAIDRLCYGKIKGNNIRFRFENRAWPLLQMLFKQSWIQKKKWKKSQMNF